MSPPSQPGWLLKLATFVVKRRQGKVPSTTGILGHNPRILAASSAYMGLYETAHSIPESLKRLVHLRAAMRVGCPS